MEEPVAVAVLLIAMVAVVSTAAVVFYTRLSRMYPLQPVAVNLPSSSLIYVIGKSYFLQLDFAVRPGAAASVCGLTIVYNAADAAKVYPLASGNNTFVGSNNVKGYVYINQTFIDRPFTEVVVIGFSEPTHLTSLIFYFCPPGSSAPEWSQAVNVPEALNATTP